MSDRREGWWILGGVLLLVAVLALLIQMARRFW